VIQLLIFTSVTAVSFDHLTPAFDAHLSSRGFPMKQASYRIGAGAKFVSRGRFEFQSAHSALPEWSVSIETVSNARPTKDSFLQTNLAFKQVSQTIEGVFLVEEPSSDGADETMRVITDFSRITITRRPRYVPSGKGFSPESGYSRTELRLELVSALKKLVSEYRPVINAIMKSGSVRSSRFNRGD